VCSQITWFPSDDIVSLIVFRVSRFTTIGEDFPAIQGIVGILYQHDLQTKISTLAKKKTEVSLTGLWKEAPLSIDQHILPSTPIL
jgi:hypothetical protein